MFAHAATSSRCIAKTVAAATAASRTAMPAWRMSGPLMSCLNTVRPQPAFHSAPSMRQGLLNKRPWNLNNRNISSVSVSAGMTLRQRVESHFFVTIGSTNRQSIRHYVRPNYFEDRPSLATRSSWGGGNMSGRGFNNPISRWLRFDTSNKVVYTILGINSAVFLAWLYAKENAARFGDRRLYVWMMKNFTNMERNVRDGRIWTLITSAFSHQRIEHFALNSIALVSFGHACWNMLGTRQFMLLYLGSALASSALSIGYHKYIVGDSYRQYSLGASGALTGLATTFACVYPGAQFMLFFVIPVPAGLLMGAFGLYEAYNLLNKNAGVFDSAGHLGGGLFGAAYYMQKILPILRRTGRF